MKSLGLSFILLGFISVFISFYLMPRGYYVSRAVCCSGILFVFSGLRFIFGGSQWLIKR